MAVATPNFVASNLGKLLVGGSSGVCASLMRWKLFFPENKKRLDNYCVAPMSAVNVSPAYCQCAGGWDVANPPHGTVTGGAYNFTYGTLLTLFLGVNGITSGYLGSFLITTWQAGHSLAEGADFEFNADLQGTLTYAPTT